MRQRQRLSSDDLRPEQNQVQVEASSCAGKRTRSPGRALDLLQRGKEVESAEHRVANDRSVQEMRLRVGNADRFGLDRPGHAEIGKKGSQPLACEFEIVFAVAEIRPEGDGNSNSVIQSSVWE